MIIIKYNPSRWIMIAFLLFSGAPVLGENILIRLQVDTPKNTPIDSQLYIAGNDTSMGNWYPDKIPLQHQSENKWEITLSLDSGKEYQFKITRGTWPSEAIYDVRQFPQNQTFITDSSVTIHLNIVDWMDLMPQTINVTGKVEYFRKFPYKSLHYKRDIIVILPQNYDENTTRRYPVLYMHDGQNIADPGTSFTKVDWGIDETAARLAKVNKIPEIIVVGVYNSPDRVQEYSDGDLGKAYMDFLIKQLKPVIDSCYRTLPDRKNTAVMGSSMGGLISFLLVWNHDDVFSKAGCFSTWFPAIDNRAFDMVRNYEGDKKNIKIYLDHGDKGMEQAAVESNQKMRDLLIERGFIQDIDLDYYWAKGTEHNESAWSARLERPLLFLFGNN